MSVQTNGESGQAPATGTPGTGQAPTDQQDQQGTAGAQGQAPAEGAEFDPATITDPALKAWAERQAAETRRARDEAARFRTEKGTLAEQVQQFQRQSETAEQAAQREQAERQSRQDALEQENRALKVERALTTAAKDAHNPGVVAQMIGPKVTYDADGKPNNVDALVAALKASDAYLFRVAPPAGGDAGAGGRRQATPAGGGISQSINEEIRNRGRGRSAAVR